MTMKLEDSFRWRDEQLAAYRGHAKTLNMEPFVLEVFEKAFSQGWDSCFQSARLHGVDKIK